MSNHCKTPSQSFIFADWPAPSGVKAVVTTRLGGVSQPPFDGFNLAQHVEDDFLAVEQNRSHLVDLLQAQSQSKLASLVWGSQVHGVDVVGLPLGDNSLESPIEADAFYTQTPLQPCLVMTADCLPVVFCSKQGDEVAVAHAGWRGLANGVLEQTLKQFKAPSSQIMAWLGPAIGKDQFEVGAEVRENFLAYSLDRNTLTKVENAFIESSNINNISPDGTHQKQKYMADIFALARIRLEACGVNAIYGGGECTVAQADRFYSYRRDGKTGRMATLIWFDQK